MIHLKHYLFYSTLKYSQKTKHIIGENKVRIIPCQINKTCNFQPNLFRFKWNCARLLYLLRTYKSASNILYFLIQSGKLSNFCGNLNVCFTKLHVTLFLFIIEKSDWYQMKAVCMSFKMRYYLPNLFQKKYRGH